MFCRRCGFQLDDHAVACTQCGVAPMNGTKFCQHCGAATIDEAIICVKCGVGLSGKAPQWGRSQTQLAAGLTGIFLGALGVHKFVLGYWFEGFLMLAITVFSMTLLWGISAVIGVIEGILYLSKSQEEFEEMYVRHKRGWF